MAFADYTDARLRVIIESQQSINDLKKLRNELKSLSMAAMTGSKEQMVAARAHSMAVDELDKRMMHMSGTMHKLRTANTIMTTQLHGSAVAGMNFGRVLQDIPYGLQGVANNIEPLVYSLQMLKTSAAEAGVTMKTALLGMITGPGGLMIAVSAITALMIFVPRWLKKTGDEAKIAAEDGLTKFHRKLAEIADVLDRLMPEERMARGEISRGEYAMKIARLRLYETMMEAYLRGIGQLTITPGMAAKAGVTQEDLRKTPEELRAAIKALTEELKDLKLQIGAAEGITIVGERPVRALPPSGLVPAGAPGARWPERRARRVFEPEPIRGAGSDGVYFTGWEVQAMKTLEIGAMRFANEIRVEVGKAWEDVFGEANSLFEKFMETVTSQFIGMMSQLGMAGLFSLIGMIPGMGLIAGAGQTMFGQLGFQHGGILREPVMGRGLRSGRMYSFAEHGPERVSPMSLTHSRGTGSGTSGEVMALVRALNHGIRFKSTELALAADIGRSIRKGQTF